GRLWSGKLKSNVTPFSSEGVGRGARYRSKCRNTRYTHFSPFAPFVPCNRGFVFNATSRLSSSMGQRCILRHVMPLYNVHPVFTICVKSPISCLLSYTGHNSSFRATTEKISKRDPLPDSRNCDHSTNEAVSFSQT
ncbi:hypothetical protein SFRURICE_011761, partial [Spodoptera frugiperda]